MYKTIKKNNPHVEIFHVEQPETASYVNVVSGYDFEEIISYMVNKTNIPEQGTVYESSIEEMEKTHVHKALMQRFYGGMEVQIGFCNGRNSSLNGLEHHKSSEILIAITDLVLLLGHVWDIKNNQYSSELIKGVFIPRGTAVEIYSTTLHLAPCKVCEEGFKSIIVLPRGTNCEISKDFLRKCEEDYRLFKRNKWLLVHPENLRMIHQQAHIGIVGSNTTISIA